MSWFFSSQLWASILYSDVLTMLIDEIPEITVLSDVDFWYFVSSQGPSETNHYRPWHPTPDYLKRESSYYASTTLFHWLTKFLLALVSSNAYDLILFSTIFFSFSITIVSNFLLMKYFQKIFLVKNFFSLICMSVITYFLDV